MNGLIPPRQGKGREMLDSVFLLRYARRIEGQAKWTVVGHAAIGAVVGYGLALAFEAARGLFGALSGGVNLMALLNPQHAVPAVLDFPWMMVILPAVLGGVWGARGLAKADEMRFKAQLALHVLKLQELVREQNNG